MKIQFLLLFLIFSLAGSVQSQPVWLNTQNLEEKNCVKDVAENLAPQFIAGFDIGQSINVTLVINELMAQNDGFIQDSQGDDEDWIEIYNYGDSPINIGGMYLTDDLTAPGKWRIPDSNAAATTIPPYGYLLVWADNETNEGILHANFRLNASGEQLGLYDAYGILIDSVVFGPQQANYSYGRLPDGAENWRVFTLPTPAAANTDKSVDVIISEIMYHPYHSSGEAENILEEYVELFNRADDSVNLLGWQLTNGVEFVFPDITLGAGQYLVVAADVNTFTAKYPDVTNVVGGWNGRLSNSGEVIELKDAAGRMIDRVNYYDQGDWSVRELASADNGHRGWVWSDEHDGGGKSLELVNFTITNDYGQNWAASKIIGGTPGRENSVTNNDIAPIILDVSHFPVIPSSLQPVTVSARIIDELTSGIAVTLHYRKDGDPSFSTLVMSEGGMYGQGDAADGVYTADIPAHKDGTIIEFYIQAADAAGNERNWPGPAMVDGKAEQVTNLLYQVSDSSDWLWTPAGQPIYYLIMTEAERAELAYIGSHSTDARSRAQMNGTFISDDGRRIQVRYLAGIHNRGAASQTNSSGSYRNNYHVNFPSDQPWNGVTAIIINNRYGYLQLLGSAVWQSAGLPAADAAAIQLRINGQNLALTNDHMYGSYVALEVIDSDFAENHFPDDPAGNAYICASNSGDLSYKGTNPDSYRNSYQKSTNVSEDDFSDLINLVYVLNNTGPNTYVHDVNEILHLEQWLRYIAVDSLAGNFEGGLNTPRGDDYALYRGIKDTRFWLIPHDLDTLFGKGDHAPDINRSINVYAGLDGLHEMLTNPDVITLYHRQFIDLINTVFSPEQFNPLVDQMLGGWVTKSTTDSIKQFVAQRNAAVLAQIPQ